MRDFLKPTLLVGLFSLQRSSRPRWPWSSLYFYALAHQVPTTWPAP